MKFTSIILISIISFLGQEYSYNNRDRIILQAGFFITIFADLFLLILDKNYIVGIALFSIVQILYSVRYGLNGARTTIIGFSILFLNLIIVHIITGIQFLIIISIYYSICLLISTIRGLKLYLHRLYSSPNRHMIALGMMFFLLCDINVVFSYIVGRMGWTNIIGYDLYRISSVSIWLFYLPSQVLLCLSGYRYELT
ncbi:MAG: hypothetical protein GX329_01265 [Tissierellia bacterium]|nr:hypothetical protein [Tissierellia bacterium]